MLAYNPQLDTNQNRGVLTETLPPVDKHNFNLLCIFSEKQPSSKYYRPPPDTREAILSGARAQESDCYDVLSRWDAMIKREGGLDRIHNRMMGSDYVDTVVSKLPYLPREAISDLFSDSYKLILAAKHIKSPMDFHNWIVGCREQTDKTLSTGKYPDGTKLGLYTVIFSAFSGAKCVYGDMVCRKGGFSRSDFMPLIGHFVSLLSSSIADELSTNDLMAFFRQLSPAGLRSLPVGSTVRIFSDGESGSPLNTVLNLGKVLGNTCILRLSVMIKSH